MLRALLISCAFLASSAFADLSGVALDPSGRTPRLPDCNLKASSENAECRRVWRRGRCEVVFLTKAEAKAQGKDLSDACEKSVEAMRKNGHTEEKLKRLNPKGEKGLYCAECIPVPNEPAESATLGSTEVSCCLKAEEVRKVISANLGQWQHCYLQALQRTPGLQLEVDVSFEVNASGRTAAVTALPTVAEKQLVACLIGKTLRWQFPKPMGVKPVKPPRVKARVTFGAKP